MNDTVYDLCIVGAGMFGSAAARHASAMEGVKVCLIGPDEPAPEEKCNREIFGAHYDEGRITRILDNDSQSLILAKNSISRYRELEKLSGISFYQPVGFLCILKKQSSYLKKVLKWSENIPVEDLSNNGSFKSKFPFIKLEENDYPLFDNLGAGHISPRKMVAAQKKVAEKQNCDIIREAVNEVKPLINGIHEGSGPKREVLTHNFIIGSSGDDLTFNQLDWSRLDNPLLQTQESLEFVSAKIQCRFLCSSDGHISGCQSGHPVVWSVVPPVLDIKV